MPHGFLGGRASPLEEIKPGMIMIAEAHEPHLLVKAFDLDYAWPAHSTLNGVFEHGVPAAALRAEWEQTRAHYPKGEYQPDPPVVPAPQ